MELTSFDFSLFFSVAGKLQGFFFSPFGAAHVVATEKKTMSGALGWLTAFRPTWTVAFVHAFSLGDAERDDKH